MKGLLLPILILFTLIYSQNSTDKVDSDDVLSDEKTVSPLEENSTPSDKNAITLAVLDFAGQNVPKDVSASLTDRFRYELMKTEKFEVMERTEMHKILEEQNFQRSDCVDQTCAVEAGQLIAVQKIVTGTIAKVGGIYTVNAKMLDVATGKIDKNKNEDCDCPIEKVLTETMKSMAHQMAGLAVEKKETNITAQRGDASLFVKTEPEDASVYIDGKLMDGRTPATFENLTPGKHTLLVKKSDLRATKDLEITGNKVTRITLKLEKQKTLLNVSTNPTEVEVFVDAGRTLSRKPGQKSPAMFYDIAPGAHQVSLFKVGYADTAFSPDVKEFEINDFTVNLTKLTDENQILAQNKFVKHRLQRKNGRIMIFGSFGVAAAGGVLTYLAQKDYDAATDAKEKLERTSITSGPEYEKLVKENKDKSDAGDLKTYISTGLFGTAGACGAVGLVFYF